MMASYVSYREKCVLQIESETVKRGVGVRTESGET